MNITEINSMAEKKESLDSLFTRLIAECDNVNQRDVTVEYIRERREEKIYPDRHFNLGSKYGGYEGFGLTFLTRRQIDSLLN